MTEHVADCSSATADNHGLRWYRFPVASDGIQFVECDKCGHGHSMRPHEAMTPGEWAVSKGWVTDVDGRDYCPECVAKGSVTIGGPE